MDLDKFLQSIGLSYEDLTSDERDDYKKMYDTLNGQTMTVENIQEAIVKMREDVCNQLIDTTITDRNDQQLKARLKNYMLLEGFLRGPLEAKKAYERMLENRTKR
jgi:hypothetical protein